MAEYEGGSVGITIWPDTTGFGMELRRKLAKYADDGLTIPLNVDVDDARWTATKRRIENDRLSQTVEVRGDTSALRKAVQDIDERDISPKVELGKALADLAKLKKELDKTRVTADRLGKAIDTASNGKDRMLGWKLSAKYADQYSDVLAKQAGLEKKYGAQSERVLDNTRQHIRRLQDAILKFKPLGSNVVEMGEANRAIDRIDREIERLRRNPGATINVDVDGVAKVIDSLEKVVRKTDEANRKEARVKVYTDGADKLQRELDNLRRNFVGLPKDIEDSYRKAIDRMDLAGYHAGKDENFKYVADLDLDVTEARRKAKEFQDDHDKIEMDLDLKSAGAAAHLAYLTRPRSVEIYAKFHATDMGKLFDGITYGATGLRGVNNQFQRLVNLFDTLDTKVPMFSAIGTAFAGLSAGAVNLTSSALGVGASLVTMSKAALAAPGALIGVGAAFKILQNAWGDKGKTFKSEIDSATTKLNGFGDAVNDAFYGKARPAIRGLMDDVSGTLIPGITGIAEAEGSVVEGVTNIIRESDKAGELAVIFNTTRAAVDNLNPGLRSLVQSFLRLSDGTSIYLPRAAAYVSDLSAKFADWVDKTRATGEIVMSMQRVVEQAGYLKDTFKGLIGIATGLYSALAESQNGIQGFSEAVTKADRAVNSAKFQTTLKTWAEGARDAKESMRDAFGDIGSAAYELRGTTANVFRDAGRTIGSFTSNLSRLLKNSKTGIGDFSSGVSSGFQKVFDAIGDSAPAFNSLLSMVGQLSKTFGGTLANTLKAAAPLIQAVATAATATAKAFSMLPAPIQSAIGLYATFGRAGINAWNTVKTGILENTVQTLAYRKTLNDLGVSAKGVGVSMGEAVSGFVAANPALERIVTNVRNANGVFGKVGAAAKGVGSAVLGAFGGPVNAAVTAGVAAVTAAYSEYVKTAQANEQASENVKNALAQIPDSAKSAADGITEVGKAIKENFDNPDYSGTKFDWWSDVTTGFDSVSDAAKRAKMPMTDLIKGITGSQKDYQSVLDRLNTTIDKYQMNVGHGISKNADLARAAQKVKAAYEDQRDQYIANSEALSQANGHAEGYARKLIELGEDSDSVSIAIGTQAQRTEMLAKAQQIAADWAERQRTAQQKALNAASDYGEVYSNMGDAITRVNQLAKDSGPIWDENAVGLDNMKGSFNSMSEAGREAQAALSNLGTSGHDLLQSMVESGASTDQVKAKQQELAAQFLDTADKMHIPKEAAEELQRVYGLTPEEVTTLFKAEADQSKAALTQYAANIRALFPGDGNTATFKTILEGINSGAITSMDQVRDMFDKLKNNNSDLRILLDAKDDASKKIKDAQKLAETLGLTKEEIQLIASGNAGDKLDEIKKKLHDYGLNDKQIQILLDAIDDASPKLEDLEKNKVPAAKGVSFDVTANDDQAKVTLASYTATDGQPLATRDVMVSVTDNTGPGTDSAKQNITSVPPEWWTNLYGNDGTSGAANAAYAAVIAIPTWWGTSLNADGNTQQFADAAMGAVMLIPTQWGTSINSDGNTTPFANTAMLAVMAIPTRWDSSIDSNGNTTPFANDARMAVIAIPVRWGTQLNANGNTTPFANNANGAVHAVPTAWRTGINAGGNTASVANMANRAVSSIPVSHTTNITAEAHTGGISSFLSALASIPRQIFTTLFTRQGNAAGGEVAGGGVRRTGLMVGQGDNTSDGIPLNAATMVSTGEYVVKASSVRRMEELYGRGVMAAINATGSIPNKYVSDARRSNRFGMPMRMSGGRRTTIATPVTRSGPTFNQTFIYPSVTPVPVQKNLKLDQYANLGLI